VRSLALLGLVVAVLAVTAVASPWVAFGLAELGQVHRFARIYDRVFEILLVLGVLLAWRRLDVGGAADIGLRRRTWAAELWRGLRAGLLGIGVGLTLAWLLGGLVPDLRYPPLKTVRKALLGLGGAALIGLGEEVLFRGVLLRRLGRDFGVAAGVAITTAIYACVHLIRTRSVPGPVTAWSGFAQTAQLFGPLADPSALPTVAGLALLGLLLAAVRLRTGSLWAAIGIHAAFVAAFRVGRLFFDIRRTPEWLMGPGWPPLVGGLAGWVAVLATAAVLLAGRRSLRRTFGL
jgi:membrane protease YdiL (CAAX protease family)